MLGRILSVARALPNTLLGTRADSRLGPLAQWQGVSPRSPHNGVGYAGRAGVRALRTVVQRRTLKLEEQHRRRVRRRVRQVPWGWFFRGCQGFRGGDCGGVGRCVYVRLMRYRVQICALGFDGLWGGLLRDGSVSRDA